jgi:hypothetical protein
MVDVDVASFEVRATEDRSFPLAFFVLLLAGAQDAAQKSIR